MKQRHEAFMYADSLPEDISFDEVVGAYNGAKGECTCGCQGTYYGVNNRYVPAEERNQEGDSAGMQNAYRKLVNHISPDNKALVFLEKEGDLEVIRYCIDVGTRTYFVTFRLDERAFKNW